MTKHRLHAEGVKVESFQTNTDPTEPNPADCICFAPPCICTNNVDCTQQQVA